MSDINLKHSTEKDYTQRMTHEMWKTILLSNKDSVVYKGVRCMLFAKDIGYGVVEVSKYYYSRNKGKIYGQNKP